YRDEIVMLHDAGIRRVDGQVSRLVATLQRLSLWESAVFVLTADHGEEFLDHGGRFHLPSRAYQELMHVPLILRVPGTDKVSLSTAPFSQIHLAPTLLEAIGTESPEEFEGISYWGNIEHGGRWETAVSESVGQCTNPMEQENR